MKRFNFDNKEKILPLLSSIMIHLMLFLVIDDIISLDIRLKEKKPQYVFIQPVMLNHEIQKDNVMADVANIKKKLRDIPEKKEEKVIIEKKVIEKKQINPQKVNIEKRALDKIVNIEKEKFNLPEPVFEKKTVQSDVINPQKEIALIDSKDTNIKKNIIPPELLIKKEKIDILSDNSKDFFDIDIQDEKFMEDIEQAPENINFEIESFNNDNKEIPKLLSFVTPEYPSWAIDSGFEGYVKFKLDLNKNGIVESIVKYQANIPSELIAHTAESVRKWVFIPLKLNDESLKSTILVTIIYRLEVKN
ncbi:MAG: energy transducer TonB [Candidatus Muirbacterium halophilum]|nr:energy transducer TonB [Candidatus Muirbacterium halophilum]